MAKIKVGDIFELNTPKGKAYLHYIHNDKVTGELIRVLKGLYNKIPDDFEKLVNTEERYMISFPVSAATKKNILRHVGFCSAQNFNKPKYMRTQHNIRGEFLGWHIVDTGTWQRQLVKTLSDEEKKLSPWGAWNDTLLIEKLVQDWSLDQWY